jgi:quercetin dioxygenase-like cupin family protein
MSTETATRHPWDSIELEQLNSQITRKLITGSNVMLARLTLEEGAFVPSHDHHNEQISVILNGSLKFLLGEDQSEEVVVRAGEVLTIPPNLPHSALALEDTLVLDIFSPPRQDWLDGDDAYLRGG